MTQFAERKHLYKMVCRCYIESVGTWLSLVEHSVRDAGVAGSNPVVPTIFQLCLRGHFVTPTHSQVRRSHGRGPNQKTHR